MPQLRLAEHRNIHNEPMIAMEVSPIRDLSTHSQAGIKILLRGPIDVRLGVLHLHEGNVIVLGGCVAELVEVQKQAHEQAKRTAGIGVDATVRALVSNHTTDDGDDGDDNVTDESEQASSDLVRVTDNTSGGATSTAAMNSTTTTMTTTTTTTTLGAIRIPASNDDDMAGDMESSAVNNRSIPNTTEQQHVVPHQETLQQSSSRLTSITLSNGRQIRTRTGLIQHRNGSIESSSSTTSACASSARSTDASFATPMQHSDLHHHHQNSNHGTSSIASAKLSTTSLTSQNPYLSAPRLQHSSGGFNRSNATNHRPQSANALGSSNKAVSSRSHNPYLSSSSNNRNISVASSSSSTNDDNVLSGTSVARNSSMPFTGGSKLPASINHNDDDSEIDDSRSSVKQKAFPKESSPMEIDLSLSPIQNVGADVKTPAHTANVSVSANGATPNPLALPALSVGMSLSPTALTVPLSFEEFQSILRRVRLEPSIYKSYEGKIFVVPAKMKGNLKEFNIEKIKNKKGKKKSKGDKQYAYTITSSFVGYVDDVGKITCKIASSVLEGFFGCSAAELRRLSKEDRKKSDAITQEGGTKICDALQKIASLSIAFMYTQEEFSLLGAPRFDGEKAHLVVIDRQE